MRTTSAWQSISTLALPSIIAGLADPLISMTDTLLVGQINSTAIAGVGLGNSVITTLIWVLSSIRNAAAGDLAQRHGRDPKTMDEGFVFKVLLAAFLLGLGAAIITSIAKTSIFSLYHADGELLTNTLSYYEIRVLGLPFMIGAYTLFGIFKGYQNTTWAMWLAIGSALMNIGLDLILINGISGYYSGFGIVGAAWASVITQILMFTFGIIILWKKVSPIIRKVFDFDRRIKMLFVNSFHLAIRTIVLNLALILANMYATKSGEASIAAFTILLNLWLFTAFFLDGFANAGLIVTGNAYGQENWSLINKQVFIVVIVNIGIATLMGGALLIFRDQFGQLFTDNLAVLEIISRTMWLLALTLPFSAIAFSFDGIFLGMSKAKFLRNVLIISTVIFFCPTLFLTYHYSPQLESVLIAMNAWLFFRALIPLASYIKLSKMNIKAHF